MPYINFYTQDTSFSIENKTMDFVKRYFATALSGKSIALRPSEISVRLINTHPTSAMIGDLEVIVTAHVFKERAENSDRIATEAAQYLKEIFPKFNKILVWLNLSELGHTEIDYE